MKQPKTKRKAVRAPMPIFVAVDAAGIPIHLSAFRSVVEDDVRSDVVHSMLVIQKYVPRDRHAERVIKAALRAEKLRSAALRAKTKAEQERVDREWLAACNAESLAIAAYEKARRK